MGWNHPDELFLFSKGLSRMVRRRGGAGLFGQAEAVCLQSHFPSQMRGPNKVAGAGCRRVAGIRNLFGNRFPHGAIYRERSKCIHMYLNVYK